MPTSFLSVVYAIYAIIMFNVYIWLLRLMIFEICSQYSFNASSPMADVILLCMSRRSCDGRRSPMPPGLTILRKQTDIGNSNASTRWVRIASYESAEPCKLPIVRTPSSSNASTMKLTLAILNAMRWLTKTDSACVNYNCGDCFQNAGRRTFVMASTAVFAVTSVGVSLFCVLLMVGRECRRNWPLKRIELADENGCVRFGPDDYELTPDERVACLTNEVISVGIRWWGTSSFPRDITYVVRGYKIRRINDKTRAFWV